MRSYGTAIFRNKEGQRMVYHLQLYGACDLETDVDNFKPCEFIEITVEDHDGSGNLFRYVAGTEAIEMRITIDPKTGADITTEEP